MERGWAGLWIQMRLATVLNVLSRSHSLGRFGRYSVVGGLGTVSDFAVTVFLVERTGAPTLLAGGCGFVVAVVQNFLLNRAWTFPGADHYGLRGQMARFFTVSLVGLGVHLTLFLVIDHLLMPYWSVWLGAPERAFDYSYRFAKLCAIGVTLAWNFMANHFWTFRSNT